MKESPKCKVQSPKSGLVIQFVGRRREIDKKSGKEKLVLREAPTQLINGEKVFDLPPDDVQKKGFTHPEADLLLKFYKNDFKEKTSKGK